MKKATNIPAAAPASAEAAAAVLLIDGVSVELDAVTLMALVHGLRGCNAALYERLLPVVYPELMEIGGADLLRLPAWKRPERHMAEPRSSRSPLAWRSIERIRERVLAGDSDERIALDVGVGAATIRKTRLNQTWTIDQRLIWWRRAGERPSLRGG